MAASDLRQLPVRLELATGESGLGFALRALRANGVRFDQGMRWLGLERHRPLDAQAVRRVAWALNVEPDEFGARMVTRDAGAGQGWVRFAGMRFRRHVATNRLYAKVCPQCLRESGVARLSWQLRATVGCFRHGYSLVWSCPHCGQAIGWDRPDVDVCRCGRHIKPCAAAPVEEGVQAWLSWLESSLSGDVVLPRPIALPAAMLHLSLDGAFGIVEALGLCATSSHSVRSALLGCRTPQELGAVVQRGLARLREAEADAAVLMRLGTVANQPALVRLITDAAVDEDRALAWWLVEGMRGAAHRGNTRAGSRPRRQLPLFIS
jgi:hypothetical protein